MKRLKWRCRENAAGALYKIATHFCSGYRDLPRISYGKWISTLISVPTFNFNLISTLISTSNSTRVDFVSAPHFGIQTRAVRGLDPSMGLIGLDWIVLGRRLGRTSWIGLGLKPIFKKNCYFLFKYAMANYFGSKRNACCLFSWWGCRTVNDLNRWLFYYELLFNYVAN